MAVYPYRIPSAMPETPQNPGVFFTESVADLETVAHALGTLLFAEKMQGNRSDKPPMLCLYGQLGAGKTTFASALVRSMPGGEYAEVASPSFTLCHRYPTRPPVLHADLYRLGETFAASAQRAALPISFLPEELVDILENGPAISAYNEEYPFIILEWADYLPQQFFPEHTLCIEILFPFPTTELDFKGYLCETNRVLHFFGKGPSIHPISQALSSFLFPS